MNRITLFWRLGLLLLITMYFSISAWQYFAMNGEVRYQYTFDKKHYGISLFSPLARLSDITCDTDDCWQDIIAEPVYFKVRTPLRFSRARVTIHYQSQEVDSWGVGFATLPDREAFGLVFFDEHDSQAVDWQTRSVIIDLEPAFYENNTLEFVFSIPDVESRQGKLRISEVTIQLQRDPISIKKIISRLFS